MTNQDPFQDSFTPQASPCWMTITQVSTLLGLSRPTVRAAAQRALSNQEAWVKQEVVGSKQFRWLIDITHEGYLAQVRQWRKMGEEQAAADHALSCPSPELADDPFAPFEADRLEAPAAKARLWPAIYDWLCTQGLQIFTNILEEPGQPFPWHFRWEDLHGEGYENEEAAIVGAFQAKFAAFGQQMRLLQSQLEQARSDVEQPAPPDPRESPPSFLRRFDRGGTH